MKLALRLRLWPVRAKHRADACATKATRKAKFALGSGLACFLLAALSLSVLAETVRPHWRDPEYGHRVKRLKKLAPTVQGKPLVVVLGSSRVEMGFNPAHLGLDDGAVVYNFSQSGCGPIGELVNARRLFDRGLVPDFLVIEVLSPLLFDTKPIDERLEPVAITHADFRTVNPHLESPLLFRARWALTRLRSWHALRFSMLEHGGYGEWIQPHMRREFQWKQLRPDGVMPWYTECAPEVRAKAKAGARKGYELFFQDTQVTPSRDRIYRDLLGLCRERGVRAAFLLMPESPEFRSWYPPGSREVVREYLARLGNEYGTPLFDAAEWMNDETHFWDGHHLLGMPSEIFSRRFGAECLGPWVKRR